MFSYYGSKTVIVDLYPKPKEDLIIEPFAGAAKYAMNYFEKDVLLIDKYEVIIKIWKWLQQCSEKDILSLPNNMRTGDSIKNIDLGCEEAYLFMGFVIGSGGQSPRHTVSPNCEKLRPGRIKTRLIETAKNLYKIRHWNFECKSYEEIENKNATWFIDPPYQYGGHVYVKSNKQIDFNSLSEWCKSRSGQTIVCENTLADWMDFVPMKTFKGSTRKTTEAIWTNQYTHFNNIQTSLL